MGMKYSTGFDLNSLRQNLFARQKKFNSDMHQQAEAGAEQIMAKSQSNSPVDTYNLEEAHHIKKTLTKADHVRFSVEVSGPGYGSDNPRDVEEYAIIIHERYLDADGPNPVMGPKSAAKAAAGHDVGKQFLARAIESEKPAVIDKIRRAVRQNWTGGSKR
jgi:hypothetical protein